MDFLASINAGLEEAKKSAARLIPPTETDLQKVNDGFAQAGLQKAQAILEPFKEVEGGAEMTRIALSGSYANPNQVAEARKIAQEIVGTRWVSDAEPQLVAKNENQAPSVKAVEPFDQKKLEQYRSQQVQKQQKAQQSNPSKERPSIQIGINTQGVQEQASAAATTIGNTLSGWRDKIGSALAADQAPAPVEIRPAKPM